jgi:predicted ATP-dependent protease
VNGLWVRALGDFTFGAPARITATVRVGRGELVDIEREAQLGGPIHLKGVLILGNYFASRFAKTSPLSLHASLVFEQSYAGIEGDSASLAELLCLLSALSDLPIRQSFAVTGSVDQHGNVQPIGGVNEKVEGFYDVCRQRGLEGQAVIIPERNVRNLMLRSDVLEACRRGTFHVYAVERVDQAIELVTGVEAGEADERGKFPPMTVNGRVEAQLAKFTAAAEASSAPAKKKGP